MGCDVQAAVSGGPEAGFLLTHPVWDVTGKRNTKRKNSKFLLTHPVWDVTITHRTDLENLTISTHTSRVGCDGEGEAIPFTQFISTHTSRVGCDNVVESNAL